MRQPSPQVLTTCQETLTNNRESPQTFLQEDISPLEEDVPEEDESEEEDKDKEDSQEDDN